MTLRHKVIVFIFLLAIPSTLFAANPPVPKVPSQYVVDLAGIVRDDVEMNINNFLKELEQKTTAQVIVLTILSLDGESIEGFSIATAEKWKLGQKGKDNGVLIVVSSKDKKYRFEIAYGLEGVLPDSLVGSIGRRLLVPFFKKGDYSNGIYAGTLAVVNEIAASEGVKITGMQKLKRQSYYPRKKRPGIFSSVFGILFFIGLIYLFIRHPGLFFLFLLGSSFGGRRSGWSSGGGFGGGFGGGGGGGFGGGGASGGW